MSCFRAWSFAYVFVAAAFVAQSQTVPRLDRITASAPSSFRTTLTGAAGAVAPSAWVIAIHADTGHYEVVQAGANGSFSMSLFAAPGGTLEIKADPGGAILKPVHDGPPYLTHHFGGAPALWGTMLQLPAPAGRFAISGPTAPLPAWYSEGTVDAAALPGGTIRIEGTYTLIGAAAAAGQTPSVAVQAGLIAVARADGKGVIDQAVFASSVMTPTGLPIERSGWFFNTGKTETGAPLAPGADGLTASFTLSMRIPQNLPAGRYRPLLVFRPAGTAAMPPDNTRVTRQVTMKRAWQDQLAGFLPVVRIGEPAEPSFDSTLLVNQFHAGARGVDAVEARGRFSLAPRIAMQTERLIVPRGSYNLEPYIPSLIAADRSEPLTPGRLLFRFPSGSLTATVRRPDGSTHTIGPKPFVQPVIEPLARNNSPLEGGPSLSTTLRLSTLDPSFDVDLGDGPHTITIDGIIEDVWGNVWRTGGTYEIDVANTLILDPGFVPGTPFQVGDRIPLHLRVSPPVAADVEIRWRFAGASGAVREETHRLRTNRFGHASGPSIIAAEAGEYRIDIFAAGNDAGGRRAGSMTWGNVIAPRQPDLVAHGRRGIDDLPEPRPQWFFRKALNHPVTAGHTFFPFHSGDVQWMTDETQESGITAASFHDPFEVVGPVLRTRYAALPYGAPSGYIDKSLADGEAPVLSLTPSGIDAHIDPAAVDYWSYGYRFVERPGVRVRELVAEEPGPFTYWRFNDRYGLQPGNGANGDLPNDFKFQFSGVVVRGSAIARPQYAAYGSLMVITERDDALGTRVTPPFQGNPGGANGGPLFVLKGREIDLFLHLTGVRAGSILHRGERVSFAGNSAPPLPSKITITVTSPSGRVRTIGGQASDAGFFADPAQDFTADESGRWTARVKVLFDGRTSLGPVSEPYPTGDVPGSREGEFWFYVIDSNAPQLTLDGLPARVQPHDRPIQFRVRSPSGWTSPELATTTTMPGFILEETRGTSMTYSYDAQKLAVDFPNLDLRDHDGHHCVDIITISFLLSGTDTKGVRRHLARQVVIAGEEMQMPAQTPHPKRRSAR
jgi:hypothetical protein